MRLLAITLITAFVSSTFTQGPADLGSPSAVKEFMPADQVGESDSRAFFIFATSTRHYTVRYDGMGESYGASSMRKKFDLKTGFHGRILRLDFLEHQDDLIVVYEVRDASGVSGYIERYNQRTLKVGWVTPIESFNIGCSVEGDSLYLAGSNLIAKVELQTGKYLWQSKELSSITTESLVGVPRIRANRLLLQDQKGRTVEVDKVSGTLLSISGNKP